MNFFQAFILGIVQGITEFLPISSSGHLVIVPYLLHWQFPSDQIFPFNVLIQVGTLLAVIIYFWKDLITIISDFITGLFQENPLKAQKTRLGWLLIIATIPAVIGGLILKKTVESAFQSIFAIAIFLLVTAALLLLADLFGRSRQNLSEMTFKNALIVGVFQLLSIFPGVSRSGSTITGGVLQGLSREDAARFSFLMSIPVMVGAAILSIPDLLSISNLNQFLPVLAIGFFTSAAVGFISIHWLLKFLQRNTLRVFSVYCTVLAAAIILLTILQ